MCENHKDLAASEVRHLPVEARGMDKAVKAAKQPALQVEPDAALRPRIVLPALDHRKKAIESANIPAKAASAKPQLEKTASLPDVEKAPEVSEDIKNLRDKIRKGVSAILADEARLPTGRAARAERIRFKEAAIQRYATGLHIDLPFGQENFAQAADILRAELKKTFAPEEAEKLMPRFLRNKEA